MPTDHAGLAPYPTIRALNLYYAHAPELSAEILATRLRASQVRLDIGIPHGRVFKCVSPHADLPDVMWDCPFADASGHDRDMDACAASPEFDAVRAHMRAMLRRFGRVLYAIDLASAANATDDVGSLVTQLWLKRSGDASIARDSVLAALDHTGHTDVALFHRLGNDADLPDWIIEFPHGNRDAAGSTLAGELAAVPGTRVVPAAWQRRA